MTQFTAYRAFLLSLSNFPAFTPHVINYIAATPVIANRSPADLARHLRVHIASVGAQTHQRQFAGAAAHQAGNSVPPTLSSSVPPPPNQSTIWQHNLANVSSKALKAALAARSNQGRTNTNTPAVVVSDTTPPGHRYCYHHGHTKNHGWLNGVLTSPCKYMAARPQQFNAAKLQAQTCQACAGGSRNVQQVYRGFRNSKNILTRLN